MMLRDKETFSKNKDLFTITTDVNKLRELFDSLDFEHRGSINYSEFLAACLARKEGLRREYAELIFRLWVCGVWLIGRIDREHDGFIAIDDLHVFFGEEITVLLAWRCEYRWTRSRTAFCRPSAS